MKLTFSNSRSDIEKAVLPTIIWVNGSKAKVIAIGWWHYSINLIFTKNQ